MEPNQLELEEEIQEKKDGVRSSTSVVALRHDEGQQPLPPSPSMVASKDGGKAHFVQLPEDEQDHDHGHRLRSNSPAPSTTSAPVEPGTGADHPSSEPPSSPKKLTRLWERLNPSLRLENSGSVARDHLASERTFLAYVRTSLAIASTGVALVQLFTLSTSSGNVPLSPDLQRFARPLGATIVALGLLVLSIGLWRYFRIQSALLTGFFPAARLAVHFVAFALGLLVIFVFGIIVGLTN